MSQVAATGITRPTIGDILLSHGFVDADTLAVAAEEQERTGQPLGQILVERGAITRLELASALAEQWAEAPAPGRHSTDVSDASPVATPPSTPDAHAVIDDDTYALRVQAAVTDLARRVGAAEPLLAELERLASTSVSPEALEASLAEIRGHVDGSLKRVGGLETGLESVGTRLDQLTDGLEEAFGEAQAVAAELAERLTTTTAAVTKAAALGDLEALRETLEMRVHELAAGIEAESDELSETRSMLAELAERSVLGPELEARVGALAARFDAVAHVDDLALLRTAIEGLAERVTETADVAALAVVREDLDELVAARGNVPPELERRLDRLEARLSEAAAADVVAALQTTLVELGAQIDNSADITSLEQLRARVDAIPAPETSDPARLARVEDLVADLAARVESVGALVGSGADATAIEELRGALEELGRRRHGDEETIARLESLSATVALLAARPEVDPALADRVAALAQALEAAIADTTVAELRTAVDVLANRDGDTNSALAELSRRLEELSSGLVAVQADETTQRLKADVDALADRSGEGESALAELTGRIEELRSSLAATQADHDTQGLRAEVDEIRLRLETDDTSLAELRAAATELASRPAGDPELAARLATITTRVDDLTAAVAATRDSTALEQLGLALASARTELAAALETVAERVATLEDARQPEDGDFAELREALTEQLREGLAGLTAEAPAGDAAWATEAARLEERLDALSALVGDGVPVTADAKEPTRREPRRVGPESDTERELERLRMAIERMAMHLGEQERALAEVMRSRGVAQRLDEIEARLDDVGAGAVANGAAPTATGAVPAGSSADARALARRLEDAETALEAEREKMLTKLDRMASSIDWRLQRLEARDAER